MSGSSSPITEPADAKMNAAKATTPPAGIKFSSSTASSSSDDEPAAAVKIPSSTGQKLTKVGLKTLEGLREGEKPTVNTRAGSPAASETSSLSSAPPDVGSDTEMVDAEDSEDAESPAAMSFQEKIAAATESIKKAGTPQKKKASLKHRITPPSSGPDTKKARPDTKCDRSAEAAIEVQKLPYQSIISMNMPPRNGVVNGVFPEPDEDNLPFGDTEDYHNSMIIHYVDEQELTYTKAAEVYSAKFPMDVITDEAVRKRHIRSLLRLRQKFGLRDPLSIPRPPSQIVRRGTPRAKKVSSILPVSGLAGTPGAIATPTVAIKKEPQADEHKGRHSRERRLLEKARIVIWRDGDKLDWNTIQTKLDEEYDWSIGKGTIEKYYYNSLERIYGTGGKKEKNAEERAKGKEGEEEKRARDGDFAGTVERLVERRMSF